MQKLVLLLALTVSFFLFGQNNQLSDKAEISVLTIGPGALLNDSFGHSGFRVKDTKLDLVFNYGMFDFDAPNFYSNFAKGKLNYYMGINYYDDFLNNYIRQNRTVKEQVLNLNAIEKQQLFDFLLTNAKPENKYYLYDFFYDNCATKIRDVIEKATGKVIDLKKPKDYSEKSFRQLIQENLNWNSWGSFGIDLALGSVIDKKATAEEQLFLPKYIHSFFANASFKESGKPLVKNDTLIFAKQPKTESSNFLLSPLFIIAIISILIIAITYFDYKNSKRSKWIDVLLFLLTGIIGIVLLLLWFATDHTATAHNYNLLWAFALNIFMIGQVIKKRPKIWFKKYLKFLLIMLCLLTLHWFVGVQVYAVVLIPFLIALSIRYLYLITIISHDNK